MAPMADTMPELDLGGVMVYRRSQPCQSRDEPHNTVCCRTSKRDFVLPFGLEDRNMTKFTIAALAALMLVQPTLTVARDNPPHACKKSSSFAPHPRTTHHVYGAPIRPAIMGRSKGSHHKHTPKRTSSSIANRDAS